jgi:hypothetical protein
VNKVWGEEGELNPRVNPWEKEGDVDGCWGMRSRDDSTVDHIYKEHERSHEEAPDCRNKCLRHLELAGCDSGPWTGDVPIFKCLEVTGLSIEAGGAVA